MKLEKGMWVRTNFREEQVIRKIVDIYTESFSGIEFLQFDKETIYRYPVIYKDFRASHNIIDLIEVGDYVNGKLVIDKWEEMNGTFSGQIFIQLDGEDTVPTLRDITSIVTKEQFNAMKYEVGTDK